MYCLVGPQSVSKYYMQGSARACCWPFHEGVRPAMKDHEETPHTPSLLPYYTLLCVSLVYIDDKFLCQPE
jgi:hypothetical protein